MTEAFDTLKASKDLQASGIAPEHSESIAEVINGAILGNVATKHDVDLIRKDIEVLKQHLLYRLALIQVGSIGLLFAAIKFFS